MTRRRLRRGVQDRGHVGAGFDVLSSDEIEQSAGAHERYSSTDRARLRFERDLGAAETVRAGEIPALHRHQAIGGAGAEHERIERQRSVPRSVQCVDAALGDVPHERFGQILDAVAKGVESAVHRLGLLRLRAVQRGIGTSEALRLASIDLAAVAPTFVDERGAKARSRQHLGAAYPGRSGADDDYAMSDHEDSGCCVLTLTPSLTGIEQARTRSPSAVHTQQS